MSELLSRDLIIKLRNMGKVFRAKTAQEWCEANHYEINESISRGLKYGRCSVYVYVHGKAKDFLPDICKYISEQTGLKCNRRWCPDSWFSQAEIEIVLEESDDEC